VVSKLNHLVLAVSTADRVRGPHIGGVETEDISEGDFIVNHLISALILCKGVQIFM